MAKSGHRLGSRNKGEVQRRPVIWWQRFQRSRSTSTLPNLWCSGNNGLKVLRELRSFGESENLPEQAKLGRIATHSVVAEARRPATQSKQAQALRRWKASDLPESQPLSCPESPPVRNCNY